MAGHIDWQRPVETKRGWQLLDQGALRTVPAVDERTRHIRSLTARSSGAATGGTVKAPMPGLVVKVLVESGQSVKKGDGLLVLEAMKMENEIAAPTDGVVDSIGVKAGTAVEKGAELARISPSPQESS